MADRSVTGRWAVVMLRRNSWSGQGLPIITSP